MELVEDKQQDRLQTIGVHTLEQIVGHSREKPSKDAAQLLCSLKILIFSEMVAPYPLNCDCGKQGWYDGMTGETGLTTDGLGKDNFNFGSFLAPGAQH